MRRIYFLICIISICAALYGQSKPLYKLPDTLPDKTDNFGKIPFLVGADNGLYSMLSSGTVLPLWTEGSVSQIVRSNVTDSNGLTSEKWFFVTSKGIISSTDLQTFSEKNNGLPFLTIKEYDGTTKNLLKKAQILKDLCVDPIDQNILVTATKDNVYLSRDSGETWKSIGSMSSGTSGMKAVAVAHMPIYSADGTISGTELVIFMSHPIYGLSYYRADASKPAWIDVTGGFESLSSFTYPDEISDILPVVCMGADGSVFSEIYLSQTFIPAIYRFDWKTKRGVCVFRDKEPVDTIDSLCQSGNNIVFARPGVVNYLSLSDNQIHSLPKDCNEWTGKLYATMSPPNSVYIPSDECGMETPIQLSEMWLMRPEPVITPYGQKAMKKKSIYVPANHVTTLTGINKYKKIVTDNKLNSLVIDMKDDYGLLRFEPENDLIKEKGYVSKYKIDVEQFVNEFKKDNIYLIARIVVFKDKNLVNYDKKQYAVWNRETEKPWTGIRGTEDVKDDSGNVTGKQTVYYDENWVDPYCEEVWEYNVAIAKELIKRGFDEIQFDYIRFPTDGLNLGKIQYRWRDTGMDKESALVSFLSYARKNIEAPIGIDIYGANGWHRSGTRTGQDVEMMSKYVDIICPMFYPSHFDQGFLNYKPITERPYRIYYYGTYRNTIIGRNHIIVRPWVQAFYLGVSYDKIYYNSDYVKREIFGVRDSVNRGYMYWNNIGRYDDIFIDPKDDETYPWNATEASPQFRKPAFSSRLNTSSNKNTQSDNAEKKEESLSSILSNKHDMVSILDSVRHPDTEIITEGKNNFLLTVQSIWKKSAND